MGKITDALKKATEDRMDRIDKISKIKEHTKLVIKKIGDSEVDSRIITYFDPKAIITEQYKTLRTNLLSLNKEGKAPQVLVVTSSLHSEGKSVTALNLAVVLAQSTHKPRVLLVDADLRRGHLDKYLGVEQKDGLTEILQGSLDLKDALFNIDIENLAFISAGSIPDNPVELLHSDKMKKFVDDVRENFDYILLDTPPIISVTDSSIIAPFTDGVLMVIQAGRTQRGIIQRSTELLHQARAKIIGYVLTNIEYHLPEYIYRYL